MAVDTTVPTTAPTTRGELPAASSAMTVQGYLNSDKVKKYLDDVLRERAGQFITSLVSLSNLTPGLAKCEPRSLMMCGLKAASMNLPLDNNLGFAYAIPYGKDASFQLGYRAYIQLAQRTGLFRSINLIDIREGELIKWDALTETLEVKVIENAVVRDKAPIIGFASMFELTNGFRKVMYKTKDALMAHGKRFSKTFNNGPWKSDVDSMCSKTLIKEMLSKWAPLSTEMQEAIKYDQAVIRPTESGSTVPEYPDMQEEPEPEAITYDMPEALLEDINNLCDICKINDAEKGMRLASFKGDVEKVTAWKKELEKKAGEMATGTTELFGAEEKRGKK